MTIKPRVITLDQVSDELKPYTVVYKGEAKYPLNKRLAEAQGVTEAELKNLLALHQEKLELFERMEALDPKTDKKQLRDMAMQFEGIEFGLQANWHFPQDRNFHEWYTVPHCACPVLDNQDRRGTQYRVIVQSCPIHGSDE